MNKYGYLKMDFKRAFCSVRFGEAVLMSVGVLLAATLEGIALDTEVVYVFSIVMYGMPAMLLFVCGNFTYADSICEDLEKKYVMQLALRGSLKKYIYSRCSAIFCSAVITMALGIFIYAMLLHLKLPWVADGSAQYEFLLANVRLHFFLEKKMYLLYYLFYGLRYGILAGILALWSGYLSLYIANRMLVLAAPMIIYYFADYALEEIFSGTIYLARVFSPAEWLFDSEWKELLFMGFLVAANFLAVTQLMQKRLRGRVYDKREKCMERFC